MDTGHIPEFPNFTKLHLDHQQAINHFTSQFPSYSDFNFTSMYAWDTNETTEISLLNNNLILKLPDYLTGEVTYSVLGREKANETATNLLDILSQSDVQKTLHFVPEVFCTNLDPKQFQIIEDHDDYDYIYLVEDLAHLRGKKYIKIKQAANAFLRDYPNTKVESVEISQEINQQAIMHIVDQWAKNKTFTNRREFFEKIAIQRLLGNSQHFDLITLLLWVGKEPVGFSISQKLPNSQAIGHFEKADISYKNAFAYIRRATNQAFLDRGLQTVNYEQDLGLEGLRLAKKKYKPIGYLKKYDIVKAPS